MKRTKGAPAIEGSGPLWRGQAIIAAAALLIAVATILVWHWVVEGLVPQTQATEMTPKTPTSEPPLPAATAPPTPARTAPRVAAAASALLTPGLDLLAFRRIMDTARDSPQAAYAAAGVLYRCRTTQLITESAERMRGRLSQRHQDVLPPLVAQAQATLTLCQTLTPQELTRSNETALARLAAAAAIPASAGQPSAAVLLAMAMRPDEEQALKHEARDHLIAAVAAHGDILAARILANRGRPSFDLDHQRWQLYRELAALLDPRYRVPKPNPILQQHLPDLAEPQLSEAQREQARAEAQQLYERIKG